jgi:hypothetical protein
MWWFWIQGWLQDENMFHMWWAGASNANWANTIWDVLPGDNGASLLKLFNFKILFYRFIVKTRWQQSLGKMDEPGGVSCTKVKIL